MYPQVPVASGIGQTERRGLIHAFRVKAFLGTADKYTIRPDRPDRVEQGSSTTNR